MHGLTLLPGALGEIIVAAIVERVGLCAERRRSGGKGEEDEKRFLHSCRFYGTKLVKLFEVRRAEQLRA